MGTSLKGKNLLPAGANYFFSEQFLKVWKSLSRHWVSSLECYFFITHVLILRYGSSSEVKRFKKKSRVKDFFPESCVICLASVCVLAHLSHRLKVGFCD